MRAALEEWEGVEHTAVRARLLREGLAERTTFLAPAKMVPGLWGPMDKLRETCSEELLTFLTESRRGLAIATGV